MKKGAASQLSASGDELFDLGVVLGRTNTSGLVAGSSVVRCSAEQAEGLKRLREEKLYKRFAATWTDFCRKYLNMSYWKVTDTIQLWDECGPAFFQLSRLTWASQEACRAAVSAIKDDALHFNGEAIPLTPENSRKLRAAVFELWRLRSVRSPQEDDSRPVK
jgi:hypothetical protein